MVNNAKIRVPASAVAKAGKSPLQTTRKCISYNVERRTEAVTEPLITLMNDAAAETAAHVRCYLRP